MVWDIRSLLQGSFRLYMSYLSKGTWHIKGAFSLLYRFPFVSVSRFREKGHKISFIGFFSCLSVSFEEHVVPEQCLMLLIKSHWVSFISLLSFSFEKHVVPEQYQDLSVPLLLVHHASPPPHFLFVCMYVFMFVCMQVSLCVHVRVCVCTFCAIAAHAPYLPPTPLPMCMYVYFYVRLYASVLVCACAYLCMHFQCNCRLCAVQTSLCMYLCMYVCL